MGLGGDQRTGGDRGEPELDGHEMLEEMNPFLPAKPGCWFGFRGMDVDVLKQLMTANLRSLFENCKEQMTSAHMQFSQFPPSSSSLDDLRVKQQHQDDGCEPLLDANDQVVKTDEYPLDSAFCAFWVLGITQAQPKSRSCSRTLPTIDPHTEPQKV